MCLNNAIVILLGADLRNDVHFLYVANNIIGIITVLRNINLSNTKSPIHE